MTDKELLELIQASEELEKRGFTKKPCSVCGGRGYRANGDIWGQPYHHPCHACEGRGYHWNGPILR